MPRDCKLEDTGTSRDIKQGVNISWSKGIEIIQSVLSYHCGIMLEINIKRYLKITHVVSTAMWHLAREIFDLAIESLSKVRRGCRLSDLSQVDSLFPFRFTFLWRLSKLNTPSLVSWPIGLILPWFVYFHPRLSVGSFSFDLQISAWINYMI